jgi:DNA-binding SARP family transcriptional activator
MKPFLEGSACLGKRPRILSAGHRISRPRLVRTLLASRTVERRIVAPTGFGKTSVAAEYAQTVFGFRDTFWINGASVCFLRDLDAGDMAQTLIRYGGSRSLAVFDDVPSMYDPRRCRLFDESIEALLDAGWEVVTVGVPGNPGIQRPGRDRILLTAADLLADTDEMRMYATEMLMRGSSAVHRWQETLRDRLGLEDDDARAARGPTGAAGRDMAVALIGDHRTKRVPARAVVGTATTVSDVPRSRCVPALVWGEDGDAEAFWAALREARILPDGAGAASSTDPSVSGEVREGAVDAAAATLRLALATMAILREGTFEEVSGLVGRVSDGMWRAVARDYPFVGADLAEETFCSVPLTPERIRAIYGSHVTEIGARCPHRSSDAWATKLAERLMASGHVAAACDVMVHLCLRRKRMSWLEGRQRMLTSVALLEPTELVFESVYRSTGSMNTRLLTGAAIRELVLGEPQQAVVYGRRAARSSTASARMRCIAAAVVAIAGSGEVRLQALKALHAYASPSAFADDAPDPDLQAGDARGLAAVAGLVIAAAQTPSVCVDMLARLKGDVLPSRTAVLLTAELAARVLDDMRMPGCIWAGDDARDLFAQVAELLASTRREDRPDLAQARMAMVLDRACSQGLAEAPDGEKGEGAVAVVSPTGPSEASDGVPAPTSVVRGPERRLVFLIAQQRTSWREHALMLRKRSAAMRMQRGPVAEGPDAQVPPLSVTLFGSMAVNVGGVPVDQRLFVKQKARMLFAVMAVNNGKEMSRRQIVGLVWPEGSPNDAPGYFYSCLSLVRKALGGSAKYCPYVVQHQYGCMLDARYVQTDMEEFNALCRELMDGEPAVDRWMKIGYRIEEAFSVELLPSMPDTPYIVGMREECRRRLTDALVRAANVLCDIGEGQAALGMAQLAFRQGLRREDMFQALMRSHALNGQREQGLSAYAACCRYLEEELGLRPTARTLKLYRRLLICGDDDSLGTAGLQDVS